MDIRFNSGYTSLTVEGVKYKIGDYVSSGRTKGTIVGIDGTEGDVLTDTGRIISHENIRHAENPVKIIPPKPVQKVLTTTSKSKTKVSAANARVVEVDPFANARANEIIKHLQHDLDECNAKLKLPDVVMSAPPHISGKLPEARTNDLKKSIEQSVENLVIHSQAGDSSEVKKAEKKIVETIKELKETAPQSTVSVTESCRVQISKYGSRDTIRIYFNNKPDKTTTSEIGAHGFRSFSEVINGRKEWYWGAFSNEKRLAFAKSFCKEEETTKWQEPERYDLDQNTEKLALEVNRSELEQIYNQYNHKNQSYDIPPRFTSYDSFVVGLYGMYAQRTPKINRPDFAQWAHEWIVEYPEYASMKDIYGEKPTTVDTPKTKTPKTQSPKSNKIVLSSLLKELMPSMQQQYLRELNGEGVQEMQPVIDTIEKQISSITKRQDGEQAIVKAHYFYGGSDWYVTEYEGDGIIYGYAILNGDYQFSEFGRSSIDEFNRVGRVEMDFHWTPRPLDEVLFKKAPDYYPEPESKSDSDLRSRSSKLPDTITPSEPSEKDKESSNVLNSIKSILERVAAAASQRAMNKQ